MGFQEVETYSCIRTPVSAYRLFAVSGVENSLVAQSNPEMVGMPYV